MNLNQDKVPTTLDEAVELLQEALSSEEKNKIKNLKSSDLHFSLGDFLRREWSLWEQGNRLSIWFLKTYGVNHADDISGIVLECLINDLNNAPRQDKILAKRFIEHWKKYKK